MKRHIVNLGATALAKAIVLGGATLLAVVIARQFGTVTLGQFSTAMSAAMLIGILFRGGLPQLALRALALDKNGESERLFATFFRSQFASVPVLLLTTGSFMAACAAVYWQQGETTALMLLTLIPAVLIMAVAQLASVFAKVAGNPVRSSLLDMGIVQLVMAAAVLVCGIAAPAASLVTILKVLAAAEILLLIVLFLRFLPRSGGMEITRVSLADRRDVTANALLMFTVRNGYPLVFMFFVEISDIGQFRLEERLAFALTMVLATIETAMMKPLIRRFQRADSTKDMWQVYGLLLPLVMVPTIFFAAACWWIARIPRFAAMVGLSADAPAPGLLFIAAPLLALLSYNVIFLNLFGQYRATLWSWLVSASIFLFPAFAAYSSAGLLGLKSAYIAGATAGALASLALLAKVIVTSDYSAAERDTGEAGT